MSSPPSLEQHRIRPYSDFEATIFLLRTTAKTFNVPRMDCIYNLNLNTIQLSLELPGVRKENLRVILCNDAVLRQQGLQVWGFTVPPQLDVSRSTGGLGSSVAQPIATDGLSHPAADPVVSLRFGYGFPPNFSIWERKHGEFYRFFPLPAPVMTEDVQVELNAGILTIIITCPRPLNAGEFELLQEDLTVN
ncbi:hypothetical protein EV361DRAFT_955938 [Lentinula raphanica]|nr:hypothetical protein EV361DRAFT_955938 [Lentinula raphanica]